MTALGEIVVGKAQGCNRVLGPGISWRNFTPGDLAPHLLRGDNAAPDRIWDSDSMIGITSKRQSPKLTDGRLNPADSVVMSNHELRDPSRVANDLAEIGSAFDPQNFSQFFEDDSLEGLVIL
jgi:hypothetical protein